ncbi:Highly reducing polyketide synthase azaB [Lachnellula arida]|uniref:Highly reducing polyketide synthase azaB n=1 Tax=Lachnellula arida TaxID=1316785 RepID=A0A8T9B5M5_9HELO|nr:Highly reducing polyketide synthase azaB [Lachnellula arida]
MYPSLNGSLSSLNLHKYLPTDLEFFILLSSLCGIVGASGQSNYSFGCAYQDALARYRVDMGQKSVSIDLGIIEGVGYTAEHQSVRYSMRSMGMQYISQEYLHALLGYYCDSGNKLRTPSEAQVVVGIMTEEEMRGKGLGPPRAYKRPLMMHLRRITRNFDEQQSQHKVVKSIPVAAVTTLAPDPSDNQRRNQASITRAICERLSGILDLKIEDISPAKALHAFGVDSLVAMEIRSWFKDSIGADVAVFDILSNISIDDLAAKIAGA